MVREYSLKVQLYQISNCLDYYFKDYNSTLISSSSKPVLPMPSANWEKQTVMGFIYICTSTSKWLPAKKFLIVLIANEGLLARKPHYLATICITKNEKLMKMNKI